LVPASELVRLLPRDARRGLGVHPPRTPTRPGASAALQGQLVVAHRSVARSVWCGNAVLLPPAAAGTGLRAGHESPRPSSRVRPPPTRSPAGCRPASGRSRHRGGPAFSSKLASSRTARSGGRTASTLDGLEVRSRRCRRSDANQGEHARRLRPVPPGSSPATRARASRPAGRRLLGNCAEDVLAVVEHDQRGLARGWRVTVSRSRRPRSHAGPAPSPVSGSRGRRLEGARS
jgi:hypothetical protein